MPKISEQVVKYNFLEVFKDFKTLKNKILDEKLHVSHVNYNCSLSYHKNVPSPSS